MKHVVQLQDEIFGFFLKYPQPIHATYEMCDYTGPALIADKIVAYYLKKKGFMDHMEDPSV